VTERLLTARQVADQLGLSVETVLRWARQGRIPAVYLSNRAIRFRQDDVDAYVEQVSSRRPRASLP
jgi:excisionase family DNA binding protein